MSKKSSIYLTDDIRAKLRTPPRGQSAAVTATIERYDALLAPEKKRLRTHFKEGEWNAMRNACNGTFWGAAVWIRGGMLANIQDSLDEELAQFGADRKALEAKLTALSPVAQFALVEMIEEFWEARRQAEEEPEI
jgi:gamma-glutamyl:cysteine ligase YbdK (ATP-grasp superfamily)